MGEPRSDEAPDHEERRPRRRKNRSVAAPDEAMADTPEAPAGFSFSRFAFGLGRMLLVLSILGGSMAGVIYAANRFLTTTPRFAVLRVQAEGSRRFGEEQLLELAGAKRGDNLFALDLDKMEQKLTLNPWIASAKLTRHLPDTLQIEVTEHSAVALAAIDSEIYLVTREGHPIAPLAEGESPDLPVVTGVTAGDVQTDRKRALERIAQGIEIADRYERMPIARVYRTQEVHLAEDGDVRMIVGETPITLVLGKGPVKQKLLMAARIIGKVKERGQAPSIVFLDNQAHPERVVVRMR
ncbi:MAG TPA: FtsQ-type POTRA domain-containing protein [Polyangiaceae bacterium]|nr:FtsQ-type POTRA domain-containing protein [Polyangiaceae bacterium]